MNTAKNIKYLFLAFYGISLIAYIYIYAQHRVANVFSSLLFYISLFLIAYGILSFFKKKWISKDLFTNLVLSLSVGIVFLFFSELSLRYLFKIGLSHSERTGSHYKSFYKNIEKRRKRMAKKNLFEKRNGKTHTPISENEFSYLHQYNEWGMRDRSVAELMADSNSIRILAIGDSYTECMGTHQDSTWLRVLERQLNAQADTMISTVNLGFSGSNPKDAFPTLEKNIKRLSPDVVIQVINHTDINDISLRYISEFKGPWWEFIYANSIIFRGIMHTFWDYTGPLLSPENFNKSLQYAKQELSKVVDQISELQRQHQFELILIFHPLLPEYTDKNQLGLQSLVEQLEQRSGLYVINLMELFKTARNIHPENAHLYYWPMDGHYNPSGYQLWGEVLAEWMLEKKIING